MSLPSSPGKRASTVTVVLEREGGLHTGPCVNHHEYLIRLQIHSLVLDGGNERTRVLTPPRMPRSNRIQSFSPGSQTTGRVAGEGGWGGEAKQGENKTGVYQTTAVRVIMCSEI